MATNTNGVIYYKLDANSKGYSGDVTKNCGLRGEEIDGNFNFLRGYDIKEIFFDKSGTIFLKRLNGEIMSAKPADTPEYDFRYDPTTATLTIVTPDGKEILLDNFTVTTTTYHDSTLEGLGRQESPLKISNVAKTGVYQPAKCFIDLTDNGATLPERGAEMHDRYVTKEKFSYFGRLYPLIGVEKIKKRLADINSEWRVPTKADWDQLLNAIDCAKPEHSKEDSNAFLGEYAGVDLKSLKYWDYINRDGKYVSADKATSEDKLLSEDTYGFSVYPVGYADSRGIDYVGGFGKWAAFWTDTEEDKDRDMFVKLFDAAQTGVGQRTWGDGCYLSLRLVKTFTGDNYVDSETIDGVNVNCIHVEGQGLIWTNENINFANSQYFGITSPEWDKFEEELSFNNPDFIRFFVNDWDGKSWVKHELRNGESLVLYEHEGKRMHEWRLVNDELIDANQVQNIEILEELNDINARISEETKARTESDLALRNEFANADTALKEEILEYVDNLSGSSDSNLLHLQTQIDTLNTRCTIIEEDVVEEATLRKEAFNELQKQINENKLISETNDFILTPGSTDANGVTTQATIKLNLSKDSMIKVDGNGIYFDGNFGTF